MSAFVSLLTALLTSPPPAGDGPAAGTSDPYGDADPYDAGVASGDAGAWAGDSSRHPIDYTPANAAVGSLLRWGCDIARARSPEPDDIAAIDRVEAYARAVLGPPGALATVPPPATTDCLITAAAMVEAFAVDFGAPELPEVAGAAWSIADWWLRSAAAKSPPTPWASAIGPLLAALRPRPRFAYGLEDLDVVTRNDNRQPAPVRYVVVAR